MSTKNNQIIKQKSSQRLAKFLQENDLHKKDFAQMIGVTLSYIYNLIDETIPFSTRATTLERIATVMDIMPEEFEEYKIPQEPIFIDESIDYLKAKMREEKLSTIDFLKMFERRKRLHIVDILRGAEPLPIDWIEMRAICSLLNIDLEDTFGLWQERVTKFLQSGGINISANSGLLDSMFGCAKKFALTKV